MPVECKKTNRRAALECEKGDYYDILLHMNLDIRVNDKYFYRVVIK